MNIRHFAFYACTIALGIVLCTTITVSRPSHPSGLSYPDSQWEIPDGTRYRDTLSSGCITYIASDSSLPLVQITLFIRHGSLYEPAEYAGLSYLTARLMRTGGTERYPADTLDSRIDFIAMKTSYSLQETVLKFDFTFLSRYTDSALSIIEEIIFHPVFPQKKIDEEKRIYSDRLLHRFQNPEPTLSSAYKKAMYGHNAAGVLPSQKSISKIGRDSIVALHERIARSGNMIVSAAGNFGTEQMRSRLTAMFQNDSNVFSPPSSRPFAPVSTLKCLIIHKDISQAFVRMGLPFIRRPHKDYYDCSLLNMIVGGNAFSSRLMSTIRSDRGLTYSIYSHAGSNYVFPATFFIGFHCQPENTQQVIELSKKELRTLQAQTVDQQELDRAKDVLVKQLPSMFRSPADVARHYARSQYYGRSDDHYKRYPHRIDSISVYDIQRVARKYCPVDSFTYVIVGDTTKLFRNEYIRSLSPQRVIPADSIVHFR